MSWHYDFHAATVTAAIHHIEVNRVGNPHFPVQAARSAVAALNALADIEGQIIRVECSGHIDASNPHATQVARMNLVVQQMRTVPAPNMVPEPE